MISLLILFGRAGDRLATDIAISIRRSSQRHCGGLLSRRQRRCIGRFGTGDFGASDQRRSGHAIHDFVATSAGEAAIQIVFEPGTDPNVAVLNVNKPHQHRQEPPAADCRT